VRPSPVEPAEVELDNVPDLLGGIERLRAVRWARLARDAIDADDEGDRAVVYFGEPVLSGYVLIKRDHSST